MENKSVTDIVRREVTRIARKHGLCGDDGVVCIIHCHAGALPNRPAGEVVIGIAEAGSTAAAVEEIAAAVGMRADPDPDPDPDTNNIADPDHRGAIAAANNLAVIDAEAPTLRVAVRAMLMMLGQQKDLDEHSEATMAALADMGIDRDRVHTWDMFSSCRGNNPGLRGARTTLRHLGIVLDHLCGHASQEQARTAVIGLSYKLDLAPEAAAVCQTLLPLLQ